MYTRGTVLFRRFIIFLLLTTLYCTKTVCAQTLPLLHFTADNGLPSNIVYSVYADKKGYTWFSTDKGIAKFNGIRYVYYTTADGLPDNEVFNFVEDYQDRLWIFSFKGTLCYFKDGRFYTPENTPWLKLPRTTLFPGRFVLNKDSSLTTCSADNKTLLHIKGNTLKTYDLNKVIEKLSEPDRIINVLKTSARTYRVWFTMSYVDIDTNLNILSQYVYAYDPLITSLVSGEGSLLMNRKGLYNISGKMVYAFAQDKVNYTNLMAVTYSKDLFLGIDSSFTLNGQLLLNNTYVTSLSRDTAGNYWISTKGDGTYYLSKHLQGITYTTSAYRGKVMAAEIFNGAVFFVTDQDNFYRMHDNKVKVLYNNPSYLSQRKSQFYNVNYVITDSLSYLRFDESSNFQLTLLPGGTPQKKLIEKIWFNQEKNILRVLKDVIKDKDDLYLFSISSIFHVRYKDLFNKPLPLDTLINAGNDNQKRIFSRAFNKQEHSIWFSDQEGIVKLQHNRLIKQPGFRHIIFRQFSFWGNYLVGKTDDNKLLICSNYNGKEPDIDTITDKNCIWDNLYALDQRHIIVTTNNYNRLLTLNPALASGKPSYRITVLEDPFIPQQAEYIKADTAFCYFFRKGGITRISNSLLFEQTPAPITVFTSFKAKDKGYLVQPHITIAYSNAKAVNITFDNIAYEGKDITCEYSLSQNDKEEWIKLSGNEINLNALGFGDFRIKVRAKTLSSNYSLPAELWLTILKPYWATWWFIVLCLVSLIGLVWGTVLLLTRRRLVKKQKEHEADMKYQQSEYKALNALMNPHFIFNSLNNIQGLINKDEKRIANEYLVIFSDLVRQNMHNISKGFISLQQELNLIENYLTLEKLRFKELVNYELLIDEEVDTDDIMIPPLMIQPLVENAVKHGLLPRQSPDSMVSIHVLEKDNQLYIEITDNGIGLTRSLQSKNRLYESFGLTNLQKRIDHLKKIQQREIHIEVAELRNGDQVTGTRASVRISLGSD